MVADTEVFRPNRSKSRMVKALAVKTALLPVSPPVHDS